MNIHIKHILCPTDFSESAEYAFKYALAIAVHHGATVELMHIAESSAYAEDSVNEQGQTYDDTLRGRLQSMADEMAGTEVETAVCVFDGTDYIEIVNRANAWPADLIVIGTHGRTGMKHLLIGSVAERVVRTAPCPVLTIRHPDHVVMMENNGEQ